MATSTTAKQRLYMGVQLSYFQSSAISLVPFLYVCRKKKNLSFKTEFFKSTSLKKKKKLKCHLGIKCLFYQSCLALIFLHIIKSWRNIMGTEICSIILLIPYIFIEKYEKKLHLLKKTQKLGFSAFE